MEHYYFHAHKDEPLSKDTLFEMPDIAGAESAAIEYLVAAARDKISNARDCRELVAHLGLIDFDLGGFSLGARTIVQAIGEGLRPRRAILGGMGYEGLQNWAGRKSFFTDAIALADTVSRGDPHWLAIQFMKTMKIDRVAVGHLLNAFEDVDFGWLDAFTMPTLVVCGTEDHDNGSAERLTVALPNATYAPVPGTHMSAVTMPELGTVIADFLSAL